jgi:hypothetical protein
MRMQRERLPLSGKNRFSSSVRPVASMTAEIISTTPRIQKQTLSCRVADPFKKASRGRALRSEKKTRGDSGDLNTQSLILVR